MCGRRINVRRKKDIGFYRFQKISKTNREDTFLQMQNIVTWCRRYHKALAYKKVSKKKRITGMYMKDDCFNKLHNFLDCKLSKLICNYLSLKTPCALRPTFSEASSSSILRLCYSNLPFSIK